MRKFNALLVAGMLALAGTATVATACPGSKGNAKQEDKKPAPKKVAVASFRVEGMDCSGCGDKVKQALTANAAIVKVDVKVADKRVTVEYDAEQLTPEKIAKMISDLGYKATAEA